jgi:hypothetical protein
MSWREMFGGLVYVGGYSAIMLVACSPLSKDPRCLISVAVITVAIVLAPLR